MPTFVAAFALQQLRDMEQLQRDFGRRPRLRRAGPETDEVPAAARTSWLRRWRARPVTTRVAAR